MDLLKDHPDVAAALATGFPAGNQQEPDIYCPICGSTTCDRLYVDEANYVIGCNECIREVDVWDWHIEQMEAEAEQAREDYYED